MGAKSLYSQLKKQIRTYMKPFDEKLLDKAFEFADRAHKGQTRKSGEPYIIHPVYASIFLAKMKVDLPTIITCLLHDVPEDTEYTLEDIEREFGDKIAELVAGITKLSAVYYKHNMQDRQIDALRRMFLVMAKDVRVVLVKLADRLHNMKTLDHVKPQKAHRIAKETMEIYSPLANLLGVWEIRKELDDLCFKYVYPEEYNKVKGAVEKRRATEKSYIPEVTMSVAKSLAKVKIPAEARGKRKHYYSIYKKIKRNKKWAPSLFDIPAIKIIVKSEDECYKALGLIHHMWKPLPMHFKDYIAVPKPNGYKSLHTTVFGPKGNLVEFQIRTTDMDLAARYGIASTFILKRKGSMNIDEYLKETPWVQKILKLQKRGNQEFLNELKQNVFSDRVFVFTKDGQMIHMPKGSSPLDLAYKISVPLGNKYAFAYVNREKKTMSYELQVGDIVEVVMDRKVKPTREWFNFVITDEAKDALKKHFKRQPKKERQKVGRRMVTNALNVLHQEDFERLSKSKQLKIAEKFGFANVERFLIAVGSGDITEERLSNTLLEHTGISSPFITALKREVRALFKIEKHEKVIMQLKLTLENRVGILSDVLDVVAKHNINIHKVVAYSRGLKKVPYGKIDVEVEDVKELRRAIRAIEGVDGVTRVSENEGIHIFAYYSTIIVGVAVWLVHPFAIMKLSQLQHYSDVFIYYFWLSVLALLLFLFFVRKYAIAFIPKKEGRQNLAHFLNFTALLVICTVVWEVITLQLI